MLRLIIFIILVLALDFYALQSFRSVVRNPWVTYGYVIISIVDLNGRLIQRILNDELDLRTYKLVLNSSLLKAGNYFMNITSASGSSSYQFEVYH